MGLTKNDIKRAVIAVLATMLFCICLCFVIYRLFTGYDGDYAFIAHGILCFFFMFIAVAISAFYAGRYMIEFLIECKWNKADKLPDFKTIGETTHVAFVTKELCILNGIYKRDEELFLSYDGLTFRQDEILSWCYDLRFNYFIRFYRFPPHNEF